MIWETATNLRLANEKSTYEVSASVSERNFFKLFFQNKSYVSNFSMTPTLSRFTVIISAFDIFCRLTLVSKSFNELGSFRPSGLLEDSRRSLLKISDFLWVMPRSHNLFIDIFWTFPVKNQLSFIDFSAIENVYREIYCYRYRPNDRTPGTPTPTKW